jgi:large subunit ribosomal protein L15
MNLNDVHRGVHTAKPRKRLGRGIGSGQGKTAGRGHKGQWSHNGVSFSPVFQGGASPLVRRIPKRGFNNRWAKTVAIINLGDLNKAFKSGDHITPESLVATNLANGAYDELKILGNGEAKSPRSSRFPLTGSVNPRSTKSPPPVAKRSCCQVRHPSSS